MNETPHWTPEEIAALIDGLVEDEADRLRLERALVADPEAWQWAERLRADRAALSEAFKARLSERPSAAFRNSVMRQIAQESSQRSWLRRWWVPAASCATVALLVVVSLPHILQSVTMEPESGHREITSSVAPEPLENALAFTSEPLEDEGLVREPSVRHIPDLSDRASALESAPSPAITEPSARASAAPTLAQLAMPSAAPQPQRPMPAEETTPAASPPSSPRSGPAVTGTVTDEHGIPLSEATTVLLSRVPGETENVEIPLAVTTTNFNGRYLFDDTFELAEERGLSEGATLHVAVEHPGHATLQHELSDTRSSDVANFTMPESERLSGRVVDATGEPVAGVRVRAVELVQSSPHQPPIEAVTDEEGTFTLRDLRSTEHFVDLLPEDGTALPMGRVVPGVNDALNLTYRSASGLEIGGQVVGLPANEPMEGARVTLTEGEGSTHPGRVLAQQSTNAAGHYYFRGLSPMQPYRVEIDPPLGATLPPPHEAAAWRSRTITLSEASPFASVQLLGESPIAVAGRVVDADAGTEVAGLEIRELRTDRRVVADPSGRFTMGDLDPAMPLLFAIDSPVWCVVEESSPPLRPLVHTIEIPSETEEFTLSVQRGVPFAGQVTDPLGHPIVGADIRLLDIEPSWGLSTPIAVTDGEGRFEAAVPPSHTAFTLMATAEGWVTIFSDRILSASAPPTDSVPLVAWDPICLRLRAVRADGSPVAGAGVLVDPAPPVAPGRPIRDPGFSTLRETDGDGWALFEQLPFAPLHVTVIEPGGQRHEYGINARELGPGEIEHTVTLD